LKLGLTLGAGAASGAGPGPGRIMNLRLFQKKRAEQ